MPDDYYEFKLKGVVIHSGMANSGHYYSIIHPRTSEENVWMKFNDKIVKSFDISQLKHEAFGSDKKI